MPNYQKKKKLKSGEKCPKLILKYVNFSYLSGIISTHFQHLCETNENAPSPNNSQETS